MNTVITLALTLSFLVFVHELGHFLAAKWAGIKVEEFAIGMGPRILKLFNDGETDYTLRVLPIGGFVRLLGEDGLPEGSTEDITRAFTSKSPLKRGIVLVAGITMNYLFAILVIGVVFAGIGKPVADTAIKITEVVPESPAEIAGLTPESYVISYKRADSTNFTTDFTQDDFLSFIQDNKGEEVIFTTQGDQSNNAETDEKTIQLRSETEEGQGVLGVTFYESYTVTYEEVPALQIPTESVKTSLNLVVAIFQSFGDMVGDLVTKGEVPADIAGPVGVAKLTSEAAQQGYYEFLQILALISINLAIVNILPFPALDGGRLVFVIIEGVTGKRVLKEYEGWIHTIGFFILMGLVLVLSYNDIQRFF